MRGGQDECIVIFNSKLMHSPISQAMLSLSSFGFSPLDTIVQALWVDWIVPAREGTGIAASSYMSHA
eukprot:1142431-Pelagomonas_calceolata.AAC.6